MSRSASAVEIEPIVRVPRWASPGETYLMTVDLRHRVPPEAWPYAQEEYALTCLLDTLPLFEHRPLGEPTLLLHRFGGTYGEVRFLLKAMNQLASGSIRLTLVNASGLPVAAREIRDIRIDRTPKSSGETAEVPSMPTGPSASDGLLCLDAIRQIEPLQFQIRTVQRFIQEFRGRGIIADEAGLGKTVEAGMIVREYVLRGEVSSWLLLVPTRLLLDQWRYSLREFFGLSHTVPRGPGEAMREGGVLSTIAHARGRLSEALLQRRWDLIIVDDCHFLRNHLTQAYKLVSGLNAKYCLLMSATPVVNDIRDLFNLVELCRPGLLGSWPSFRDSLRNDGQVGRDLLVERLSSVLTRTRRAETGLSWPSREHRSVSVKLTTKEMRYYEETIRFLLDLHWKSGQAPVIPALPLLQITIVKQLLSSQEALLATLNGQFRKRIHELSKAQSGKEILHRLDRLISRVRACPDRSKFQALLQALKEESDERKILVFTQFLATQTALAEFLERKGVSVSVVSSGLSMADGHRVLHNFRSSKAGLLILTDAVAPGVQFMDVSVVVHFDFPWNPIRLERRIACVDRPSQQRDIKIVSLYAQNTIESEIQERLHQKSFLDAPMPEELLSLDVDLESNIARNITESRNLADLRQRLDKLTA